MEQKRLPKSFFARNAAFVAEELLGKILVRKTKEGVTAGRIVETEAYYGARDPASRAFRRTPMSEVMWDPPGKIFVYMVHNHWMFNVVTGKKGVPSAVLFRALEPMRGIELMKRRRGKEDIKHLCSGPGKLTKAMGIDKKFNGEWINRNDLKILWSNEKIKVAKSHRIGVTKDLKRRLRFYIKNNPYVSKNNA